MGSNTRAETVDTNNRLLILLTSSLQQTTKNSKMKLFNIMLLTTAVMAGKNDNSNGGRNENIDPDVYSDMKKACKEQIRNKVESEKFKEKLNRCLEKRRAKYLKKQQRAADKEERVAMKQEINELKEEKAEVKEERSKCKAACDEIADQSTKQNCKDYWATVSRERIQAILEQVGDKRDRNTGDVSYCLTDAGLTGSETTCKEFASEYCVSLGQSRPSKDFRDCRSACLGNCMKSETCVWQPSQESEEVTQEGGR